MAQLLLDINNIEKSFGGKTVLCIDNFSLYKGEKVGLIGENGAGKSTFLKIITGEIKPDTGTVRAFSQISYIGQTGDTQYETEKSIKGIFSAPEQRDGLSGGEKTRRRIAGALSMGGGILLADEPTTDLDKDGIVILERELSAYTGGLILVSHDRELLDKLCTRIIHLEDGKITSFPGNYTNYRKELANKREYQQFKYDQYRAEEKRIKQMIQAQNERIDRVRLPSRMGESERRLHRGSVNTSIIHASNVKKGLAAHYNMLEKAERPREDVKITMEMGDSDKITSKTAIEFTGLKLTAGKRQLLSDAEMRVPTGSKTVIMGKNGCGKSTLINTIVSGKNPKIKIAPNVKIGLFDQDHLRTVNLDKTVIENVMYVSRVSEGDARTVLARLNIRGDAVYKSCGVLSGGELSKTALAMLLVSDVNLLILDEPTNHLDIFTMEALEPLLNEYKGTVLCVSHDRRFANNVFNRLVIFENKKIVTFEGTLFDYEASKSTDRKAEQAKLDKTVYQMRLAELSLRMSKPKKGDSPEKLNAEYERILKEMKELT